MKKRLRKIRSAYSVGQYNYSLDFDTFYWAVSSDSTNKKRRWVRSSKINSNHYCSTYSEAHYAKKAHRLAYNAPFFITELSYHRNGRFRSWLYTKELTDKMKELEEMLIRSGFRRVSELMLDVPLFRFNYPVFIKEDGKGNLLTFTILYNGEDKNPKLACRKKEYKFGDSFKLHRPFFQSTRFNLMPGDEILDALVPAAQQTLLFNIDVIRMGHDSGLF